MDLPTRKKRGIVQQSVWLVRTLHAGASLMWTRTGKKEEEIKPAHQHGAICHFRCFWQVLNLGCQVCRPTVCSAKWPPSSKDAEWKWRRQRRRREENLPRLFCTPVLPERIVTDAQHAAAVGAVKSRNSNDSWRAQKKATGGKEILSKRRIRNYLIQNYWLTSCCWLALVAFTLTGIVLVSCCW